MREFNRNLAVVIGINNYQNGIDALQTAVPDAVAIAEILQNTYKYQLVHPDFNSGVLVDGYATKKKLKKLFTDILPNKIKPTNRDRLIVYFAGHGIARESDEGPEGYLIPQDAKSKDPDSLLKMRDVHNWLAQLECKHLLIILDCCFAGTFRWASYRKLIPIVKDITKAHYDRFIKFPAWQVLTSASHNQEALDFLNNRDIQPNRKHSPFAEGLIEALKSEEGDLNNDGVIIATELYLYLRDYVELNSKEKQTPGLFPLKKHDRGEYLFKLPNTPLKLKETPELNPENNPYRGLKPFEERHDKLFFGREEVINELFNKVTQSYHQLTIVTGISGSGKSSLVKAGLIPYLKKLAEYLVQRWEVFDPIRPGTNPYTSLARFLSLLDSNSSQRSDDTTILGRQLQKDSSQFIQIIDRWSKKNPNFRLLLVIDQFEELITMAVKTEPASNKKLDKSWWQKLRAKLGLSTKKSESNSIVKAQLEEWQKFIKLLAEALPQCPQLNLVITIRSDFELRFQEDSEFKPYWRNARFLVRSMNPKELREAVEKPAAEKALYFEPPELVDRLVDEVSSMPAPLPLLSFTLSEMYIKLYEAWNFDGKEDRALTVAENFWDKGGVAGALTRRANEEYENLPLLKHKLIMRRVMLRMVELESREPVRRRVFASELKYSDLEENKCKNVLKQLVDARLIVTGTETESENKSEEEEYYEPAHDFLVTGWDKLQEWIREEQKLGNPALQNLLTPAAKAWDKNNKPDTDLWNSNSRLDRLKEIKDSKNTAEDILSDATKFEDNWLNKDETEFVQKSIKQRRRNKIMRWSLAGSVILGSVVFSAAIWLQLQRTQLRQKAAEAENLLSTVPLEGLVLAIQTMGENIALSKLPFQKILNPVQSSLISAVQVAREENVLNEHNQKVSTVAFSPDGNYVVSGSWDNTLRLWDRGGNPIGQPFIGHHNHINAVDFSPNSKYVVSGSTDGTVRLWNLQGQQIGEPFQGHHFSVISVTFDPTGKYIVSYGSDGTLRWWNYKGEQIGQPLPLQGANFASNTVAFSPDGKHLVGEIDEFNLQLWNLEGEPIGEPAQGHEHRILSVAFSPDGKYIVSGSEDNTLRLWKLEQTEKIVSQTEEIVSQTETEEIVEIVEIVEKIDQIKQTGEPWMSNLHIPGKSNTLPLLR